MSRVKFIIFLLVGAFFATHAALAEERFALLIGNQNYASYVGPLTNPHNDIEHVGKALRKIGFKVTILKDAEFGTLQKAVKKHVTRLMNAGPHAIGFLYYSGHGAMNEQTRTNYIIPVDVKSTDVAELWDNSIRLEGIIDELRDRASNATHFVVFDACRNELQLSRRGSKSLYHSKGFTALPEVRGMLIAYATAEGEIASDKGQGVGPYAKALSEEIVKPGLEAVTMFRRVQLKVYNTIQQEPWYTHGAIGEIYFAGQKPEPAKKPANMARPPLSEAAQTWLEVRTSSNQMVLKAFIEQFSGTVFAYLAQERLNKLQKKTEIAGYEPSKSAQQSPDATRKESVAALSKPAKPKKPADEVKPAVGVYPKELRPGDSFKDCGVCPEMMVVPTDSFLMGSPKEEEGWESTEGPIRRVKISRLFAIGKYEITFDEWDACVADGGCKYSPSDYWGRGNQPVSDVSWNDITKEYIPWLNRKTGKFYRLPTEAEWEFAARANTRTPFWWGSTISTDLANYNGNHTYAGGEEGEYRRKTVPVNRFQPNPFGLYNVHGNVWEWVEDCWHDNYQDAPNDGSAWLEANNGACNKHILRGGSWIIRPSKLRSASRVWFFSDFRSYFIGFRLSRTITP